MDDDKSFLDSGRSDVYMNGKKGLMKGEYYMEVLGYDEKKVV